MIRAIALAVACTAACTGDIGVVTVELTTAPGSVLLDGVHTLRLTITNPHRVFLAERTAAGFALALDLPASGDVASISVDGLDADGALIATGASPPFAFGGITGHVVIYMAPPDSVAVAPNALEPARSELGVGVLPYGALLAGGTLSTGAPSPALQIYNAFDHSLIAGSPMPAARSGVAVGVGSLGVYLFGGADESGAASSRLWRFDTTEPPAGSYFDIGDKPGFARSGERLVALGNERFLVTGTPAAELRGLDGSLTVREDVGSLPHEGVSVVATDGVATAIFAGDSAVIRCRAGECTPLAVPGRAGARVVALPGGKVALVCGDATMVRIDAATGSAETLSGPAPVSARCAAAATARHLVIAGGMTAGGEVDAAVHVYDVSALTPVVTASLTVPRTGATAIALPNDQVLIAGGIDAAGAPVATLELFTPAAVAR
jgi:hypothetical protein